MCIEACEGDDSSLILKKKSQPYVALALLSSPPRCPSVLQTVCVVTCHCLVCHLLLGITSPAGSWLGWQHGLPYPLLIPLLLLAALFCFLWFRNKFHIVAQVDLSSLCTLG